MLHVGLHAVGYADTDDNFQTFSNLQTFNFQTDYHKKVNGLHYFYNNSKLNYKLVICSYD